MSMLFEAANRVFRGLLPEVPNALQQPAPALVEYAASVPPAFNGAPVLPGPTGQVSPAPAGSLSARNLAAFNFGNVKTSSGGYQQYLSREDGLMGVGERVLRYNNAPDRGWNAQTLRQMVDIYAPASDRNNPAAYAAFLGKRLGVDPNAPVNFRDPTILAGLIQSMPVMEHGAQRVNISQGEALAAAHRLLRGEKPRTINPRHAAQSILQKWGYR